MAEGSMREKRASKRPAWLLDGVDLSVAEADGDAAKQPRQPQMQKRHIYLSDALQLRMQLAQQEQPQQQQQPKQHSRLQQLLQPKQQQQPKQPAQQHEQDAAQQQQQQQQEDQDVPHRMCLNEYCKSPFESPQWRRGPLGPGTLCNACGTRYARMEAKKKGDKRGAKLRPHDLLEWAAFQEQRQWPLEVRQTWVLDTVQARLAIKAEQQHEEQQQQPIMPARQQQEATPAQQQQTSAPECETGSAAEQQGCDQGDGRLPQAAVPSQQVQLPQPLQLQPPLDSRALQRASAAMLCRVQQGAAHTQLLKNKKQQRQQQHSRDDRLQETQSQHMPETYQMEADITARLAGLSTRRQQQQQQQQQPRQGSTTTSRSSSSSGQVNRSRAPQAAAGGRQQQQLLGCDDSSGRDQLLQLLAVGEALFKAEQGGTSDDEAGAQDTAPSPNDYSIEYGAGRADSSSISVKRPRSGAEGQQQLAACPEQQQQQQQQLKRPAVPRDKDRFRQLLAEAEDAVRARSGSPALARPITPHMGCAASAPKPRAVAPAGAGSSAPDQAGAGGAAPAGVGIAADGDPQLQLKPADICRPQQQQQQQQAELAAAPSAGAAAGVAEPDVTGLAPSICNGAAAPSAAPATAADAGHSNAVPEQRQQQQQPQQAAHRQKQSLLLHMLSGLLTAALGLPAAPGSMHPGSEVQHQVQQVLADPATQQLLEACLADKAGTAWLGEFLSKLGFEQGLLQQPLQSRLAPTPAAAASSGSAEPATAGACSDAAAPTRCKAGRGKATGASG